MKLELDLNTTYQQPANDDQVLHLIDGPLHLIELSKGNVQRLLTIASEVRRSSRLEHGGDVFL